MATLYDEAGAVVATGLTVLNESRLTQRRTDVVHDPLLGGLPYVVTKTPGGLAGNLEFLCSSGEVADAVYAAHLAGPLRLDTWTQQNVITDPRATTAPPWAAFGVGSAPETMVSGAVDGPGLPDGTQATTYARYTIASPGAGNAQFGYNSAISALPAAFPAGGTFAFAIYVRSSVTAANVSVRKDGSLAGAGAGGAQSGAASSLPAGTWQRRTALLTNNAAMDGFRIGANFPVGSQSVGQVIDVTCAMLVLGATEVPDHFDGATLDTASLVNEWFGTANASVSQQYERPALNLTYIPITGVGLPVHESRNYWRVSVPSVQEVTP